MRALDAAIAVVASSSFGLGCGAAVIHPIHVPPTPAEIYEINVRQSPIYVELLPTTRSAGITLRIKYIVSADAEKIVVAHDGGPPFALRAGAVSQFHASPPSRTAIGAALGGGVGVLLGLGLANPHRPDRRQALPTATLLLPPAAGRVWCTSPSPVAAGAVGALIGGAAAESPDDVSVTWIPAASPPPPRSAAAAARATPLAHPQPRTPGTSALVVVQSAEVRSAPFEVAPVIVVLAHGEHLFVDETSPAGWRVAFLPEGRVGYIQDAQVRVDAP